jgi:hypothetical protein
MKKLIMILTVGALSLLLVSCEKEGCTDTKADNFDSGATKQKVASCNYTFKYVFYVTQAATINFPNITTYKFYMGSVYIGSLSKSQALSSAPNCEATTNVIRISKTWTSNSGGFTLNMKDQNDNGFYSEGKINVVSKQEGCNIYGF